MAQAFVPAGEFTMGSEGASGPAHKVQLNAFWIDKTEVTNAMFVAFLNEVAGSLTISDDDISREGNLIYNGSSFSVVQKYANHPVTTVTWNGALAYCEWADRRLPTEAEWEKAARGTDERIFPWGNNVADMSLTNYQGKVGDTTEVGHYPNGASPYWVLDMAGNVWEWVNDWYAKDYYEKSPLENPSGPTSGDSKVLRGGSWLNVPNGLSSDNRIWNSLTYNDSIVGFRCAASP
jgi:serine/threonine-protein kinase